MNAKKDKVSKATIKLLITKAEELFSRYGIQRVSVEEICREAGVSKMTFYRAFPNKIAIAKHLLKKVFSEARQQLNQVKAMNISFEEKIQKILVMKMEFMEKYSREFIKDLISGSDPELKAYIEEENQRHFKNVRKMFVEAQKKGEVRPEIKIDFIMHMLFKMRETFQEEAIQRLYPNPSEYMKEAFNFFYYGILKK